MQFWHSKIILKYEVQAIKKKIEIDLVPVYLVCTYKFKNIDHNYDLGSAMNMNLLTNML